MSSPLTGMRRETGCAGGDARERPVFPARSAGSPWTVLGTGDVAVQPRPGSVPGVLLGRWQSLPLTGRRAAWPRAGAQGASRWLLPGGQRGLSAAAPGARRPHKVIVVWRRARRLGRLCRRYQPSPGGRWPDASLPEPGAVLHPPLVLAATLSAHGSAAFDVHVPAGLDGDAVEVAAGQALPLSRLVRRLASASMVSSSSASILACRSAACWAR
jgi:hypothetical protein